MGAALSIFVLLSVSVFVIRVTSVALRLTGLSETTARFQALSAFTGTGYTTSEAETIVNYPVRRRIVALLMIIGNMGLVSVFATLVVSMINTDGDTNAVIRQLLWLLSGLVSLWLFMLNPTADRILCSVIGKLLARMTFLGRRHYQRLLQVADGFSICEHPVPDTWLKSETVLNVADFKQLGLTVLTVRSNSGGISNEFSSTSDLSLVDSLVIYGSDTGHETLERGVVEGACVQT